MGNQGNAVKSLGDVTQCHGKYGVRLSNDHVGKYVQ